MADIIDLALVADAKRYLNKMLEKRGIAYFLSKDSQRPYRLEATRVEMVLRTAARARSREGSRRRVHSLAVDHARKEVRRELIRRVVAEMLQTGF
ncbi:MAG: hypothetical protein K1X64_23370 [Myxococcaceae bacterium]|nr:hypothetical protein [Myxococcaceae bacterium]